MSRDNRGLSHYFATIGRFPVLTREEEVALARGMQRGRGEGRDRLILSNLRLVVRIARPYRGLGLPFEDLVHEGNLGLIEAARRYDDARGLRFCTYAVWWIRKSILTALADQGGPVRFPPYRLERLKEVRAVEHSLRASLGRDPERAELSRGLSKKSRIDPLLHVEPRRVSLDEGTGDGERRPLFERLADPRGSSPEGAMISRESRQLLLGALSRLEARERFVLLCRLGMADGEPLTLKEIGSKIGVSRERVRQIEQEARARLWRLYRRPPSVPAPLPRRGAFKGSRSRTPLAADGR